jgi:ABC-type transporter Mla subunit MlaD
MSGATEAIKAAMQQLPEDLRNSMTSVTTEMVAQLTRTLGESTEHTKKILAIYAEQELRVKSLHAIIHATQSALAEIKESHKVLENLPVEVKRLAVASTRISANLERIPVGLLADAASTLAASQRNLTESSAMLHAACLTLSGGSPTTSMVQGERVV